MEKKYKYLIVFSIITLCYGNLRAQTLVPNGQMTGTPTMGEYYHPSSITLQDGFHFAATHGNSLRLYISGCVPLAATPSNNQNYVITYTSRKSGVLDPTAATASVCDEMQTIKYFDGLGRPMQTVQVKGNPDATKDLVQPVAYDQFGREAVKYLPYTTSAGIAGSYRESAIADQLSFYHPVGTAATVTQLPGGLPHIPTPYAATVFEASPLNRPVEQGAPGNDWQPGSGHTVRMEYGTNTNADAFHTVKLYNAKVVNAAGQEYKRELTSIKNYDANELYLNILKDENWVTADGLAGQTHEYKDKEGRVVLKRIFNKKPAPDNTIETLSTYYVYDDLGNLSFVLPPGCIPDNTVPIQATQDAFCYQYRYDHRNRLIEKKLPGKGWEGMVYNKLDQVIFSQDANQKARQEVSFVKYDALGRVIMTGIEPGHAEASMMVLQQAVNEQYDNPQSGFTQWEVPQTSGDLGYTNTAFPTGASRQALTVNYYDDYTFLGNPTVSALNTGNFGAPVSPQSKNVKGLLTGTLINILGTGNGLLSVNYYDEEGRVVQSKSRNHLQGTDIVNNTYSFTDELLSSTRVHTVGSNTTTIANTYNYDHMGRKLETRQWINNAANEVLLSKLEYNEVGQLKTKSIGNGLETMQYAYNERGWLKSQNAPRFNLSLNYQDHPNAAYKQWNGNISAQVWGPAANTSQHHYDYHYDKLNRLTEGTSDENFNEQLSYDVMGNITQLTRSPMGTNNYHYGGNQLTSIDGFVNGTYEYDENGNQKKDNTKGITIAYNLLNLPQTITKGAQTMTNQWLASGVKTRKVVSGGITRDYVGGIEYNNGQIEFIQTEEGRAVPAGGGNYTYDYYLKDHLGNTRVQLKHNGLVLETSDYYPFGLQVARAVQTTSSPENRYKYNGKELQTELDLNQYDYGARFYDPVIGRWTSVDPLAELGRRQSPYEYALDNPIRYVDPDGMYSTEEWKKDHGVTDDDLTTVYKAKEEEENDQSSGIRWQPLYKSTLLNYVQITNCTGCGPGSLQNKTGAIFEDLFEEYIDENFNFDNIRVVKNPLNNKFPGEFDYTVPDFLGVKYDIRGKPGAGVTTFYELESFYELKATKNNIGVGAFDGQLKVQIQAAKKAKVKEIVFVTTYGVKLSKQLEKYAQNNGISLTHYWAQYRMERGVMKTNYTPAKK
ncbi:DUF6443 domain-containing protein [Mucilaginibacter sp. PAMB04168]|uniref:DUF6443 domain-containing protein n=1 Tax=Mucilaginibacter sp. PAMB04168 TaxID=3138567 RepID=UPI0031F6BA21